MALSEKHRRKIYDYLVPELGEETTSEMMSYFPARDVEEPVTKEFMTGELALVRMEFHDEIAELRTEMRSEIAELRTEMRTEIAGLRTEMRSEIAGLRTEMRSEIAGLRTEFVQTLSSELRNQLQWIVGIQIALLALVVGLVVAFV